MPDKLFALAEKENILVGFFDLPWGILGAYYYIEPDPPVILLHKEIRDNRRLLRCIFAEELGHYFTTMHDLLAFARTHKHAATKYENIAQWWATQYLVPLNRLKEAVSSGVTTTYDLAEYFDVTERFMGTSLRLYREKSVQF